MVDLYKTSDISIKEEDNMNKRILAAVLTASMAAAQLTACSSGNTDTPGPTGTPASESKAADGSQAPASGNADSAPAEGGVTGYASLPKSDVVDGEVNQQTFPISEEKITLTMWYPLASSLGELADYNDSEFWQWYEEKTNIHIDFVLPATGTEKDNFNLLFASGDIPDIVYSCPSKYTYRGGEDAAIEDGYFVNMAEHLDLAPNYVSWLTNHEDFGRAAFTDTGKMYGIWGIWDTIYEDTMAEQGLAIRKDFLDKVGMEVPTTYDEWETVLRAFKDELSIEAPFYTSKYGIDNGEFIAGFDTAPYFYQRDGVVQYGPLDDQYKDYLEMMHKWWEEGLLDKDFATRSSTGISSDKDMMLNDKIGALVDWATRMSDTYITRGATNPDYYLIAAPQPKLSADSPDPAYRYYYSGSDHMHGYCANINADSPHIEEAIRWVDGLFAEDVFLNANYGLEEQEGTVWYKAEDGHRIGNYDFRFKNPNGLSSATVLAKYWVKTPPVFVEAAQVEQADANKQESYKIWSQYKPTNFLPGRLTLTTDEGNEYASKYTDIETYVQECNVKFIMGQMSLDDYDSYRDTLRSMGIEDCIALKQAALERYLAR